MTTIFRSPSGKTHTIQSNAEFYSIDCAKPGDSAGQWIIYSPSTTNRLVCGIRNGRPLERMGDTLVFSSSLDEAGEEFVAVLNSRNLLLVRLALTTQKLSLEDYYELLKRHHELLGVPRFGAGSVSGEESASGRTPVAEERAFRLVRAAFEVLRNCRSVRPDLPKHPRGFVGRAGIDAFGTLAAWKRHRSWYRAVESPTDGKCVRCGTDTYVEPLRTIARPSVGGNLFLGAMITSISDTIHSLPKTVGGQMAAGLLEAVKRALASMDVVAPTDLSGAQELLVKTSKLPQRSKQLVSLLHNVRMVASGEWEIGIGQGGRLPFGLPETELVFQRVAVAAVMHALGTPVEEVEAAYGRAGGKQGLDIQGLYTLWADTPLHALEGWREHSTLPSGYRPDLMIQRRSDSCWLLIDAKLRKGESDGGLLSRSGIKDLQAYMHEYGLQYGVLLVPGSDQYNFCHEDVDGGGCRIRAISIPSRTLLSEASQIEPMLEGMWN